MSQQDGHSYTFEEICCLVSRLRSQHLLLEHLEGQWTNFPYSVEGDAREIMRRALDEFLLAVSKGDWISISTPIGDLEEYFPYKVHITDYIIWFRLINLKIKPCSDYLIGLIEILYKLSCGVKSGKDSKLVIPDPKTRASLAEILARILKKVKKSLQSAFILDFVPLIQVVDDVLFPPRRVSVSLPEEQNVHAMINLVLMARRWFDPSAVLEWLNKLIKGPIDDHDQMARVICLTALAVPSKGPHIPKMWELLKPDSFVWKFNSKRFEGILMCMLARSVKNTTVCIPLEEAFGFYYGIFFKHLKLSQPENAMRKRDRLFYRYQSSLKTVCDRMLSSVKAFAKFIAYSLIHNPLVTLEKLQTFMQGLDSYFHPSNSGPWTEALGTFSSNCCSYLARAIANEEAIVSDEHRTRFAELMWPAVEKLALSKNPFIEINAASSIRWLVYIDPTKSISRQIYENSALTLASLCEPHRTLACIGILSRIARIELETYKLKPSAADFEPALDLFALLPQCTMGIDYNDPFKTLATLSLFASVFTSLPMDRHTTELAPSQDYYEELISVLLDRSFMFIESLAAARKQKGSGGVEVLILNTFAHVWYMMFNQMPRSLWKFAINKVKILLLESKGAGGSEMVSRLALACKGRFHNEALAELLPPLLDQADFLLKSSNGKDSRSEDATCANLIWVLSALNGLLRYSGFAALPFKQRIYDLIPSLMLLRQERCVDVACKMVKSCVRSWSDYYPLNVKGWSEESFEDHLGVAARPLRMPNVHVDWFQPSENSMAVSLELVKHVQGHISLSAVDTKVHLKFKMLLLRLFSITNASSAEVSKELGDLCATATDESLTLEIRSLSLAILDISINYYGYSAHCNNDARLRSHSWLLQLQNYPKQKLLPPIFQMTRYHIAHKRFQLLKRSVAHRGLEKELVKTIVDLSLANFGSIRRPAQALLIKIYKDYPTECKTLLFDSVMPRAEEINTEGSLKGAVHTLGQCQRLIAISFMNSDCILDFCFRLMKEHSKVPKLAELTLHLVRDIVMAIYPRDPAFQDESFPHRMMDKNISLYQDQRSSWKVQIIAIFLMYILSENTVERELWTEIVSFFLECMSSENAEVRSLAVNRGSKIFRHYTTLFGSSLNNPSIEKAICNSLQYLIQDYQTGRDSATLGFRIDCGDLFWSLAELSGVHLVDVLDERFVELALNNTVPHIRATAEAYSGCLRGLLTMKDVADSDLASRILVSLQKRMDESGSESMEIWYEAGHLISTDLDKLKVSQVLRLFLEPLQSASSQTNATTISMALKLRFLCGLLRNADWSQNDLMTPLCANAIASPFELLRSSATKLLLSSLCLPQIVSDLIKSDILTDTPQARSLLIFAELMALDPVQSDFWSFCPYLIKNIAKFVASSDPILQNEAKRILKLISWTSLLPTGRQSVIIQVSIELIKSSTMSVNSRRALIEFLRLFYARNLVECFPLGKSILDFVAPVLSDPNVELRQEAADLFKVIFHSNADLSQKWKDTTFEALRTARNTLDITQKHGLVLIASSLVLSSPYTIPMWMPCILTQLTRYLNERHPVQGTVRGTFSDFKRTHGDSWERDRSKFTEDELEAISELLVAPSYYA